MSFDEVNEKRLKAGEAHNRDQQAMAKQAVDALVRNKYGGDYIELNTKDDDELIRLIRKHGYENVMSAIYSRMYADY